MSDRGELPGIDPWTINRPGFFIPLDQDPVQSELAKDAVQRLHALGVLAFEVQSDMRKPLPLIPYDPSVSGTLGYTRMGDLREHLDTLRISDRVKSNVISTLKSIDRRAKQGRHESAVFLDYISRDKDATNFVNPILFVQGDDGELKHYQGEGEALIDLDKLLLYFKYSVFKVNVPRKRAWHAAGLGPVGSRALTDFMNSRIAAKLAAAGE